MRQSRCRSNDALPTKEKKRGKSYDKPHVHRVSEDALSLAFPVSTTYLMLGIVIDVSAMLVATTHSLTPFGGGSNTFRRMVI